MLKTGILDGTQELALQLHVIETDGMNPDEAFVCCSIVSYWLLLLELFILFKFRLLGHCHATVD